jgi:hypothetical protein
MARGKGRCCPAVGHAMSFEECRTNHWEGWESGIGECAPVPIWFQDPLPSPCTPPHSQSSLEEKSE